MHRLLFAVALVIITPLTLAADTLILHNGTRIQGELLSVRGSVIEFEERGRSGRGRTIRIDRDEVARIEFESGYSTGDNSFTGGGRPAGLRERQVSVPATVQWTDTGVDLRSGQTIYFEASGQVRWGRDRRDGPEGESDSPNNPGRPIPNRPAAALIGRIGSSSDFFLIGDEQGAIRARGSGRLYLGVNDDFLPDNSGSFRVIVYY